MAGTHGALHVIEVVSERLFQDLGGLMAPLDQAFSAAADGTQPEPKALAVDTAHRMMARLRLVHAAWGPGEQPTSVARIQYLARGLPRPVTVDVSGVGEDTVFPASIGRVLLNLLLLAADGLPHGGVVGLAGAADDLFIQIDGPEAAWPAGTAVCLVNETDARAALDEPRGLQMALTALLARAAGLRLSVLLAPAGQAAPAIIRLGG